MAGNCYGVVVLNCSYSATSPCRWIRSLISCSSLSRALTCSVWRSTGFTWTDVCSADWRTFTEPPSTNWGRACTDITSSTPSRYQHVEMLPAHLENRAAVTFSLSVLFSFQKGNLERTQEFFQKQALELQGQVEWREWFVLPFIPNPEQNPTFSPYFSRQWADTFLVSLHNFLSVLFQCMHILHQPSYKVMV